MADKRRKFDAEFREGAVWIVTETGKTVAEVAKDLGINETTLASRVSRARRAGTAPGGGSDVQQHAQGRVRPPAHFVTRAEARIRIATWIIHFYNARRLHSVCGFKSPIHYEHDYGASSPRGWLHRKVSAFRGNRQWRSFG
ncbi:MULTISPECIES: transposase [Streptomyces]|uniref:Transposase n=1 Tax=Streptomyces gibsoniae TaxID=3075529 RepID=A0ABU2U6J7_9ACTN|nr:transposase [Streptomyces sp. DSM 41699]MDT0468804.1 transposase [Streptomyces sp. DSM 41699]